MSEGEPRYVDTQEIGRYVKIHASPPRGARDFTYPQVILMCPMGFSD